MSTFITYSLIPNTLSALLFIVKLYSSIGYALRRRINKLNMKEWFIKRGYPESVIEKELIKVRFSKQGQKSKKVEKGLPFAVT